MPYDTMSPELSLEGADEISSSQKTKSGEIRAAAFHALSDAILKPIKQIGGKAPLSAAMAVGAGSEGPPAGQPVGRHTTRLGE